jgi:hypothetical protein
MRRIVSGQNFEKENAGKIAIAQRDEELENLKQQQSFEQTRLDSSKRSACPNAEQTDYRESS